MTPEFWGLATATVSGAAFALTKAIGDASYVRAQHHAYRAWELTGKAVTGWSEHWIWAHDKTPTVARSGSVVVNVVTTITNIVNVTQVQVRSLPPTGGPGADTGTASPTARVLPGPAGPAALPCGSRIPGEALGAMTRAVTSGGAR